MGWLRSRHAIPVPRTLFSHVSIVRWDASPARDIRDAWCPGYRNAAILKSPESRPTQGSRLRGSSLEMEREVLILQEGPVSEVDDGIRCLERWHPHGVVVGARKLSVSVSRCGVGRSKRENRKRMIAR